MSNEVLGGCQNFAPSQS